MVEAEGVEVKFTADDKDVNTRLDNLEKRLGRAQDKAKKGGKSAGAAFFGGFAGGVAGVVASGASQTGPVSATMELLMNIMGAALLPLLQGLMPLLKSLANASIGLGDWMSEHPQLTKTAAETAAGAYIGGKIAGTPGAVVGGIAGAQHSLLPSAEYKQQKREYYEYLSGLQDKASVNWWERNMPTLLGGMGADDMGGTGATDYDLWVSRNNTDMPWENSYGSGPPAQEQGRPYDPHYPPPNVGELHGPTVVNTG